MAMEVEIAIVGGGLGGLALAVGLQERGIQAHVFEKAPRLRKHSGTSIGIANNGTFDVHNLEISHKALSLSPQLIPLAHGWRFQNSDSTSCPLFTVMHTTMNAIL
jgi:2-polyprenyl-6-methoxyphenol hydroxylase-like FAD-dependent oxidoreductase